VLDATGGHWNVLIQKLDGEVLYSRNPDERVLVASVIKVPVAVLYLKSLERLNIPDSDLQTWLIKNKIGNLSNADLLRSMLVYSDEPSTDTIIEAIDSDGLNIGMAMQSWGVDINIYNRVATVADINRIWQGLYNNELISPAGSDFLLKLLSTITDNDVVRLGDICTQAVTECTFYNKRGTITDETLVVADSALIKLSTNADPQVYILTLVGSQSDPNLTKPPTDYYMLDAAIAQVGSIFAGYFSAK